MLTLLQTGRAGAAHRGHSCPDALGCHRARARGCVFARGHRPLEVWGLLPTWRPEAVSTKGGAPWGLHWPHANSVHVCVYVCARTRFQ